MFLVSIIIIQNFYQRWKFKSSRVLLQKLLVAQIANKFPSCYGPYSVHKSLPLVPTWASWIQSTCPTTRTSDSDKCRWWYSPLTSSHCSRVGNFDHRNLTGFYDEGTSSGMIFLLNFTKVSGIDVCRWNDGQTRTARKYDPKEETRNVGRTSGKCRHKVIMSMFTSNITTDWVTLLFLTRNVPVRILARRPDILSFIRDCSQSTDSSITMVL
jgi:hypothetical protein